VHRWATFDCYGTLIDWNGGIRRELERLFGAERAPSLLERYHELEPQVQGETYRTYADVLALTLERLAADEGLAIPEGESAALVRALPSWEPFPEVPAALREVRARGWSVALLSNSDRGLISASMRQLDVPIDLAVVAEDVNSYKPGHGHWERFFEITTAERDRYVHVAQSHFHDIAPAIELGLTTVWVNRLGESAEPPPTRELPDLSALPGTLDALVPA
jgi:2-haloacid dehalogenase